MERSRVAKTDSQPRWQSHAGAAVDARLEALMEAAADALAKEDALLRGLVEGGRTSRQSSVAFAKVGKGLSYWVYETTLVYVLWKRWCAEGETPAWDWTFRELRGERRGRMQRGGLRREVLAAFEAKWWNRDDLKARMASHKPSRNPARSRRRTSPAPTNT